jgi:hypothetical protein
LQKSHFSISHVVNNGIGKNQEASHVSFQNIAAIFIATTRHHAFIISFFFSRAHSDQQVSNNKHFSSRIFFIKTIHEICLFSLLSSTDPGAEAGPHSILSDIYHESLKRRLFQQVEEAVQGQKEKQENVA